MEPTDYTDRYAYVLFRASSHQTDELMERFVAELQTMYARYAQRRGWRTEVIHSNVSWQPHRIRGALRVLGGEAYRSLAVEEGIHRAQRFPSENPRIDTTLVAVDVVPEAIDAEWEPYRQDVHEEIFHAFGGSGPDHPARAAVRLTYAPRKLVVSCCEDTPVYERSQESYTLSRNRTAAWSLLLLRLRAFGRDEGAEMDLYGKKRRTYNFVDGRVTDHLLQRTTTDIAGVLDGDLRAFGL